MLKKGTTEEGAVEGRRTIVSEVPSSSLAQDARKMEDDERCSISPYLEGTSHTSKSPRYIYHQVFLSFDIWRLLCCDNGRSPYW